MGAERQGNSRSAVAPRDGRHRTRLVVEGQDVALTVRRNPRARRLTLRLDLGEDGIVVTIPPSTAVADGVALARNNLAWISARLASRPERVPFEDGQVIPLRGSDHRIRHCASSVRGIFAEDSTIHVGGAAAGLGARLEGWLRNQARLDLTHEVVSLSPRLDSSLGRRLDHPVGRVTVRDTRSRWGSCAANGNLSFCWRLILAPQPVLAYVVAHELAHLVERNHGPRFWAQVGGIAGDVSAARAWLKRHGPGLHRYG